MYLVQKICKRSPFHNKKKQVNVNLILLHFHQCYILFFGFIRNSLDFNYFNPLPFAVHKRICAGIRHYLNPYISIQFVQLSTIQFRVCGPATIAAAPEWTRERPHPLDHPSQCIKQHKSASDCLRYN